MRIYDTVIEWKEDKLKQEAMVVLIETEEESNLLFNGQYDELMEDTGYDDDDILHYVNGYEGETVEVGANLGDYTVTSVLGYDYVNEEGKWDYAELDGSENDFDR
jgi:hypothetical protein